ncbi:MAG TPA: hypothetical protein VGA89_00545 [Patescibacteria group bacterium]|jgi:hypothetical protein
MEKTQNQKQNQNEAGKLELSETLAGLKVDQDLIKKMGQEIGLELTPEQIAEILKAVVRQAEETNQPAGEILWRALDKILNSPPELQGQT